MVDLDPAEGLWARACRDPLFTAIVIDHHSGPGLTDTRLTHCSTTARILLRAKAELPGAKTQEKSAISSWINPPRGLVFCLICGKTDKRQGAMISWLRSEGGGWR